MKRYRVVDLDGDRNVAKFEFGAINDEQANTVGTALATYLLYNNFQIDGFAADTDVTGYGWYPIAAQIKQEE